MSEAGGAKRWLKYGCFGCLGVVGLLVLLFGTVGGLAWLRASSEEVGRQESAHPLPRTGAAPSETTETAEAPATPGAVVIEVQAQAEIRIEPGSEEGPLRVEASYDTNSFTLEEAMEGDVETGWTYRLRFHGTGSGFLGGLARLFGGSQPELRILLPADVPMTLDLRMSQGGALAQLGGLSLTSADIDIRQGGIHLEFAEPMRAPMEHLSVRAAMGGFGMEGIGNASPRKLDIDCSMGGGQIGLDGAWLNDSEIDIHVSMGGAALELPRNVHVVGVERSRVRPPRDEEAPLPTLTFSITKGTGGDVEVIE